MDELQIGKRMLESAEVLDCVGKIKSGGGDHKLFAAILDSITDALYEDRVPELWLDFRGVSFVERANLSVLTMGKFKAAQFGGSLKIVNPVGEVKALLEDTNLCLGLEIIYVDYGVAGNPK